MAEVSSVAHATSLDDRVVRYDVWERDLVTGSVHSHREDFGSLENAQATASSYNGEVSYVDRYEPAPTREFFVVKTTLSFEEVK